MAETKERCVLTLPLLTEPWQEKILEKRFKIFEHLENSLINTELKKLHTLERTREYIDLSKQIQATEKENRKPLYKERQQMLQAAGFSEYAFKDAITPMQKHFVEHIGAQIAHKAASDVWRSFSMYLYGKGNAVHFKHRGSLNSVASQSAKSGMKYADNMFYWNGGQCENKICLAIRVAYPSNDYEREMLTKEIKSYRVVRKWMKTRYKYYLQFMLVGSPVSKGRYKVSGRVGIKSGLTSIAVVSDKKAEKIELASKVQDNANKIAMLQRKMDASRRATNPDNYNADGTIRRGRKTWTYSNHYKLYAGQVRELQRKNADIRKYQHTCLANYILSQGSDVYVNDTDYKFLQERKKETEILPSGRIKSKKRYGKTLANRAPAMLMTILNTKLLGLGAEPLHKITWKDYHAYEYDHTNNSCKQSKFKLPTRVLSNGDVVDRDLYAAFLIKCAAGSLNYPDKDMCAADYDKFKKISA